MRHADISDTVKDNIKRALYTARKNVFVQPQFSGPTLSFPITGVNFVLGLAAFGLNALLVK